MKKIKTFTKTHPNAISVTGVVMWFVTLLALSVFTSCKGSQQIVEIVKTDTLHVVHTDTVYAVHNDTIYKIDTKVVHDSIIREIIIKEVVNEAGEVIHSEKETNNEVWHNSDSYSQLIQHTVDSILKVKMDSISHSTYNEKPVLVEVEKQTPWYTKAWNWIVGKFAWIGLAVILLLGAKFILPYIWKK